MILTTQVTADYYEKAKPLFESIAVYWPYRFVLGCIDFDPEDYDGEKFIVNRTDIKSYRENFPSNRKNFITMQNGEFAEHIACDEDDIICCIDADTIIQRTITYQELCIIVASLDTHDLISTRSACPPLTLHSALQNLGCKLKESALQKFFGTSWQESYEFTTSLLIARKSFFRWMAEKYNEHFDDMTMATNHHAGVQWLASYVCRKKKVFILPPTYQCASWYSTFPTSISKGKLMIGDQTVLFNHTKFNA